MVYLLEMVIFHSYVSLPEGILPLWKTLHLNGGSKKENHRTEWWMFPLLMTRYSKEITPKIGWFDNCVKKWPGVIPLSLRMYIPITWQK